MRVRQTAPGALRVLLAAREIERKETIMPCRVGITADPRQRRKAWEKKIPSLRYWVILESGLTKASSSIVL